MIISSSLPLIHRNVSGDGNGPFNQQSSVGTVDERSGDLQSPPMVVPASPTLDKQTNQFSAPERIDLRVLRVDPPSLANQRALDAYHTAANLNYSNPTSFGSLNLVV